MKRWAGIAGVAVVLGLMAQGVPAASTGFKSSTSSSSGSGARSSGFGGNRPHHHHNQHRHQRSVTGIVVVPAFVPGLWYYAPALPYGLAPPAYITSPTFATDAAPAPRSGEYWYFCPNSRQYYPYVRECASGWLAVVPGVPGPPN